MAARRGNTSQLTSEERRTYQSLRDRGYSHNTALNDALDGVQVDDVRQAHKEEEG